MDLSDPGKTLLFAFLIILFVVWLLKRQQVQKGRFPPGPPALPLLGNLFHVNVKAPHKSLIKLSEQYGPVYTVWFGTYPAVVLCGFDTIKEALIERGNDFGSRYPLPTLHKASEGYGVIASSGERWKQLRRFSLSTLRNFGMGKKSIEERIQEEAQFLVKAFRNKKESPFNPDFLMRCAASNIICSIVFGDRFEYGDKEFLSLLEMIADNGRILSGPWVQLYNNFPKIMEFLPGPHKRIFQNVSSLSAFLNKSIQSHKESLQKHFSRDYIDSFLIKMDEEKHNLDSEFNDKNLLMTTMNLFLAGTETTSTTLRWAIQILAKYPQIQEKIHQEIDEVIGSSRCPSIEDRTKMPYTDAVIHEVQRYVDLIPMNLPHMASNDIEFRGYLIPKGTFVIPVLSSVLKSTSLWEKPDSFDPNHFLDKNGCFKNSESFMPFSAGKRKCLGESLARMELFLFLTTLLQNFVFNPVIDHKDINISSVSSGILHIPHVYKFCAISRYLLWQIVRQISQPEHSFYLLLQELIFISYAITMDSSNPATTLLLALLSVLLLLWFLKSKRPQYGRLPPAPPALPIVGNLFQMDIKAPHKSLIKLSKQYGPVFTLWFGGTPVVVLCGFETLKEGLIERGYDFSGRYLLPILKKVSDGYGIAFSNGERWKQLRRFSLSTLKNFGMGKRSIEERIQEEAQCLVTAIRNKQELPFNPDFLLRCAVSNIICSIVFGDRFEYEDERFLTLMERTEGISNAFSKPGVQMYNNFPKIMDFLPGSHHKILQNMADLKTFVNQMIQSHRGSLQKDFPRDYIDSFLIKMDEEKHKPDSEFIDENLLMSVINLFLAGTESTSTTLQWAIQILVKFPHIQEKIYQEICEMIGSYRRPAIEDRAKMPYTDAVIHEVQRYIDLVPMNIPHMATKDVEFRGYLIPKGTFVITVLSSALKATSQWETPDSFNPNHFLDENGCFKQSESFMAFSAGKRMCLGASLARMELFLFLTTLLQNFVFNSITDHEDIDISPATSGILVKPHVYKFCAISR
ncbi:uncharacterized protein LOC122542683 [Chiloscyllium plagiosum]|uniref:uncharacterized protein LOC122542683 n=1 Tax=Chiloscyllium plagiosum TaxID=36176 RepID=UPI001CB861BC|nr:uncharacterized protein LOC122542683 [Chiloscyllium plagiosum]